MRRALTLIASVAGFSCTNDTLPGGSSGLVTAFDSTADTITARVEGQVPVPGLRTLEIVMRIAPAPDDTSLFADFNDFEVDAARRIWIYDYRDRRMFLFDSAGTLVRRVGRKGQGPGEFEQGNGMVALADTGIAFLDSRNARISFFAANGDFRSSFPVPSGAKTSYVARDRNLFTGGPFSCRGASSALGIRSDGTATRAQIFPSRATVMPTRGALVAGMSGPTQDHDGCVRLMFHVIDSCSPERSSASSATEGAVLLIRIGLASLRARTIS